MKNFFKIHYIIFFFVLFLSKAIAEPTFVQSYTYPTGAAAHKFNEYGLTFNNDGTKMYIPADHEPNGTGDYVKEYTLTTAYDISTATVTATKLIFVSGTHEKNTTVLPTQVVFNNDGTKMFTVNHTGTSSNPVPNVDYWSLSTAFDLGSTVTLEGRYNISAQEIRANSIAFNNDGTKMFIAGVGSGTQNRIHEYSLATAFDLSSTVTHLNSEEMGSYHTYIDGVTFNHDGTKMYTIDSTDDQISQFKLTTPYDVSTLSLEGTFDVSSVDTAPREVTFSHDGSKMFFIVNTDNAATGKVHEFNLSCNWSVIDGACDDPADTSDEGKDISSSIESQTATSKQIAIQASTPVLNRMYWLRRHRTNDKLSNQNIKFNFSNSMMASLSKVIPVSNKKTNDALDKISDNWSFWSEGSVSFGRVGDTSSSSSKDIDSKGITIGMDKKISENKMYGYALRFGNDYVDVGTSGTSLDTDSYSLSVYGTFPHDDKRFAEAILGISTLKTDHV